MPSGHPEGLPDLFLDRTLGRVQVPTLLRAAEHFLSVIDEIDVSCREAGPFLYAVSSSGLRRIDL